MISEDIKLDPVDDHPVEPPRRWLVRSPETWHEMARVVEATQTAQVYGCFVAKPSRPRRPSVRP
jgi:mRNA-degrading endonuclease toxin of MazEF toxin-antitoxin module